MNGFPEITALDAIEFFYGRGIGGIHSQAIGGICGINHGTTGFENFYSLRNLIHLRLYRLGRGY